MVDLRVYHSVVFNSLKIFFPNICSKDSIEMKNIDDVKESTLKDFFVILEETEKYKKGHR